MPDTPTTPEALAAALDAHNRWRGDDDGIEPEPNPTELGRTIDAAAGMLRTLSARVAALEAERATRWHWHDLQAGAALPECDGQRIFVGVNVNGYTCTFNGTNGDNCWTDTAEGTEVLMSGLRWWAPYVSPMDAPAERAAVVPALKRLQQGAEDSVRDHYSAGFAAGLRTAVESFTTDGEPSK